MSQVLEHSPASELPQLVRPFHTKHPEVFTGILIVLVSLIVGVINPAFFQISTFFDLLRSSTVTGMFALGVLIVLAAGGIDVSFTAIAALTMYSLTKLVYAYWPSAPIFERRRFTGHLFGFTKRIFSSPS
jgi:simple sugar transport system permease protein